MSYYHCPSSTSHDPTDQNHWVGCQQCTVDHWSTSTGFFTKKHLYEPGDPIEPFVSYFTYDPRTSTLTIDSTGEAAVIHSATGFIGCWTDPSRSELLWNQKHQSANLLVNQVSYGETGSFSTASGKFTSDVTGVIVAKAQQDDAHAYPVNPGGPVTQDLVEWPWICSCGAKAPRGQTTCLACEQKSGHTLAVIEP